MPLPSKIHVHEYGDEIQYVLPRRPLQRGKWVLWLLAAIGLLMGLIPTIPSVSMTLNTAHSVLFWFFGADFPPRYSLPITCRGIDPIEVIILGLIFYPLSTWFTLGGLVTLYGNIEITLQRGWLHATDHWWPMALTRRRRVSSVLGFRVKKRYFPNDKPPTGQRQQVALLLAEIAGGKPFPICDFYTPELMLPIAQDLARRCNTPLEAD